MQLIYEPLTIENSKEFFHLAGNRKVAETMRFTCPSDREESDLILRSYLAPGNRTFAVRMEKQGRIIGVFAFKSGEPLQTADLSVMIEPELWGRGTGQQIMEDMTELACEKKWYTVLEAYILESNLSSRRIVEKNGFSEKERYGFPDLREDLIVYRREL